MTANLARGTGSDTPQRLAARPPGSVTLLAFTGVAVTSLGGPLALAALYVPGLMADASSSAGLAVVAAAAAFGIPLWIWLDYSREVGGSGGLYDFTRAAAGQRIALVQAGLWIVSYLLYLAYTTAQIVYDLLPAVLPGERRYQTLLEVTIPVVLAAVMIAGRASALLVIGIIAAGQLALAAVLGGLTLANVSTPVSTFGGSAPAGSLAIASGQTTLLFICGSLPFYLGGEASKVHIRRGVTAAYLATVVLLIAAVAPLAADPAIAQASIPGMAVAQQFAGRGLAVAVGIGVAASTAGVILVEYLALSRLLTAVTRWPTRKILIGLGAIMAAFGPVVLISPDRIYDDLLTPSLVALWLSSLVTFAVYPRFALMRSRRSREGGGKPGGTRRVVQAWVLAAAAVVMAGYGVWTAIQTTQI